MDLGDDLLQLLRGRAICYLATTMRDGSPQLTQTWVDTDGTNIIINTVQGYQKVRNIERDPRVAVTIADPDSPHRYFAIRGRVLSISSDGAADGIESLAQKYTGQPYSWYSGRDQVRLILTIAAEHVLPHG